MAQAPAGAGAAPAVTGFPTRTRLAPDEPWWQEARQTALAGRKIQAIKEVRRITGLGLKDSKQLVEQHIMAGPAVAVPAPALGMDDEARQMVRGGRKIQAIKMVRERTKMGLREAKAYVEAL